MKMAHGARTLPLAASEDAVRRKAMRLHREYA
jgi:hypothetical protein